MRKAISLFLAFMLFWGISTISYADFDLSGMSFDELVALKEQVNLAIWNSKEWQEVEVPQGIWEVGKDIPAGKWTVKACPEAATYILVGTELKNNGNTVAPTLSHFINDEGNDTFHEGNISSWTFDLKSGDYVQVSTGTAIFMPYTGNPSLGFKDGSETVESETNAAVNDKADEVKPETEPVKPEPDDLDDGKLINMEDVVLPTIQRESTQSNNKIDENAETVEYNVDSAEATKNSFAGTGDDVIMLTPINKPYVFEITGEIKNNDYFTVTAYNSENKYSACLVDTRNGDKFHGYTIDPYQDTVMLEVECDGAWEIKELPLSSMPTVKKGMTVTGSGDSILVFDPANGEGKTIVAKGDGSQERFEIIGYNDDFKHYNGMIDSRDKYEGRVLLKDSQILIVKAYGDWTITFE